MKISRPRRRWGLAWLTLALLLAVALVADAWAAADQEPFRLEWSASRLSVTAAGAHLSVILDAIARRTGVDIQGRDAAGDRVWVEFARLPMREGLRRLLVNMNYATVESPSRGLLRVMVLGRKPDASVDRSAANGPASIAVRTDPGEQSDPDQRIAKLFACAGRSDLATLRQAASDPDQTIRSTAFRLLAQKDAGEASALANAAARSPDLARRLEGIQELGQVDGPDAAVGLSKALADPDLGVKEYAIEALATQADPGAVQALRRELSDPNPPVRLMALNALAQKGQAGKGVITAALHSDDPLVRDRAAELIEQMGQGESPDARGIQ